MHYFVRKSFGWLAFLAFTVLFFSLPIILRNEGPEELYPEFESADFHAGEVLFEFLPTSAERIVDGDSAQVSMITRTDSAEKAVYLYVNGEERGMAVVSDSMEINFPKVYLSKGENEIDAVLCSRHGDTLAVRKMRIVSQKKL